MNLLKYLDKNVRSRPATGRTAMQEISVMQGYEQVVIETFKARKLRWLEAWDILFFEPKRVAQHSDKTGHRKVAV